MFRFTVGRRGRRRSRQVGDDGAAHPEDVRRGVRPDHRGQLQQALGDRRQDMPAQWSVSTPPRRVIQTSSLTVTPLGTAKSVPYNRGVAVTSDVYSKVDPNETKKVSH